MKVLKGIFLVLIIFPMIIVLTLLQVQFSLQNTVLSSKYFDKMYDKSDLGEAINEMIVSSVEDLTADFSAASGETKNISDAIDADGLEEISEDLIKGFYAYFAGREDSLPEIDIEPLKDIILDAAVTQFMADDEMVTMVEFMISTYENMGETVDEEAIAELAPSFGTQEMGDEMYAAMIEAIEALDKNLSSHEKAEIIVIIIMKEAFGYEDINDEIDLDEVINDVFEEDENPLLAVREILLVIKENLFWALLAIFLILALIVILTAFRPASIFGWLSAPLVACGLFGVGTGLLGLITPTLTRYATTMSMDIGGNASEHIQNFMQNYMSGISIYFLVSGAVLLAAGIVFIILAALLSNRAKISELPKKKTNAALLVVRIVLVLALLIILVFVTGWLFGEIYETIDNAAAVIERSSDKIGSEEFFNAIEKAANFSFSSMPDGN